MERKKAIKTLSTIYLVFGLFLFFIAFATLAISFYPQIWYSIDKEASNSELTTLKKDIKNIDTSEVEDKDSFAIPAFDESLPKENKILISIIGVNSDIVENDNADEGLKKGIWIVPNFGTPELNNLPIIIAAHRFGYIEWTKEFRETSSFYNLPKLKSGDRVQIIWNQRSYEYEVYKSEDNTQITDYNADLILYTCRMYNSPVRVFKYLDRVK
ncbi:sortase [Candidatus Microgenomates bacterium]|nr:sortase [Candidatus Microgenomates bacterium]